jgi:hypothetical protein
MHALHLHMHALHLHMLHRPTPKIEIISFSPDGPPPLSDV